MNVTKKNKLAMYRAANAVLTKPNYQSLWEKAPGFSALHEEFTNVLEEIDALSNQHGVRRTGIADDKDAARMAMCKAANVVAGAVAAFAHRSNNHELLTRVDTTLSVLLSGRGQDSSDKCKDILAGATANLPNLADYELQQSDLDQLNKLIVAYDKLAPQPQVARAKNKSAGQALEAAFDKADGVLNNGLDKLMLKYESAQPEFFRDYTNARMIVDLPAGRGNGADGKANATNAATTSAPSKAN